MGTARVVPVWRCCTVELCPLSFIPKALFFALGCLPVDAFANWLSTVPEDGHRPEQLVAAEDLLPVLLAADIVGADEWSTLHLKVLNRGLVRKGELDVEAKEHGHEDANDAIEHVSDLYHQILDELLLVLWRAGVVVSVE